MFHIRPQFGSNRTYTDRHNSFLVGFLPSPAQMGCSKGKNPYQSMVSGVRGASRDGHGILYEYQPLVCTLYVYAGGLGGCPVCYAAVRLDVSVAQYDHAECQ